MACLSPTRGSAVVRDLLGRMDPVSLPPDRQAGVMANSLMMAATLALFTPSSSGTTAVDRLVKQRGTSSPAQAAAVAALRRARFRLLRVEDARDGTAFLSDVVSEEHLRVDEDAVPPGLAGLHLIAWLAPLPDGTEMFVSAVTPLDEAGLALTAEFVRPGRPELVNPLRCAEAVFRHGLQNGIVAVPGLNAPPSGEEDGFNDEPSDLDALALAWAEPGAVQDPNDVRFVREQADLETVVAMLASAANTRGHGLTFLSGAYAAIVQIQLETVQRRAAAGSGSLRLTTVEAAGGDGHRDRRPAGRHTHHSGRAAATAGCRRRHGTKRQKGGRRARQAGWTHPGAASQDGGAGLHGAGSVGRGREGG